MKIIGNENNKERVFHWFPTLRCNYRCEYCCGKEYYSYHNDRYLETAKIIRDVILPVYRPYKIETVGGEISILDKKLVDIFLSFNPNNYGFMHFITNGSNLDWFLPIKDRNHQITVSIHESQREIDDIIYNIEKYRDLGLNIFPSIVLTKYNSEVVRYVKNKLPELFIQPEINTSKEELETSLINQIMFVDNNIESINPSYVGKSCKCKSNLMHMSTTGILTPCTNNKYPFFKDHILNHNYNEIKNVIDGYINEPIINCDSACYPCITSMVQYFEE